MKKLSIILSALVFALVLSQCKKEEIPATTDDNTNNGVMITLSVGNNSRADVNPTGNENWATISYEVGDSIYVGYNGAFVGCLQCISTADNGSGNFEGFINIETVVPEQKLHFYMLGGKGFQPNPAITDNQLTVNLSDQTTKYPVISYATSNEDYAASTTTYTSDRLMNKCSIMKFNVTTDSDAPICITGMNNKVTLNFNPSTANTDEGFSYSMDETDGGLIKMAGGAGSPAVKWAIVLPQAELTETGEAYSEDQSYIGTRPTIHAIESNKYYHEGADVISMTVNTQVWNGNLAALTGNEPEGFATARNGMTVYGTLDANVKVSIADGATVTLDGATINGTNNDSYTWAGINCLGDANIILSGSNTVKGFYQKYPGVHVPSDKTLTISGSGSLNASSNGQGAGIGGGHGIGCGNIVIKSGVIYATGGTGAAGIGSGYYADNTACGNITIENGTVEATGGQYAAGIGCGVSNYCGNILIKNGSVIAQGGDDGAGIGAGAAYYTYLYSISVVSTCGTITIEGGTVNATGGQYGAGIGSGISVGGENSKSTCGNITITGGTVTATGGTNGGTNDAAGIGTGYGEYDTNIHEDYNVSKCGDIEITGGDVTAVTRSNNSTTAAIGKANYGICTKVTIRSTITRVEMTKVQAQSTETLSAFVNATDLYFNDYNCTSFLGMDFYNGRSIEIGAVNMRFSRSGNTLTVTPIP